MLAAGMVRWLCGCAWTARRAAGGASAPLLAAEGVLGWGRSSSGGLIWAIPWMLLLSATCFPAEVIDSVPSGWKPEGKVWRVVLAPQQEAAEETEYPCEKAPCRSCKLPWQLLLGERWCPCAGQAAPWRGRLCVLSAALARGWRGSDGHTCLQYGLSWSLPTHPATPMTHHCSRPGGEVLPLCLAGCTLLPQGAPACPRGRTTHGPLGHPAALHSAGCLH